MTTESNKVATAEIVDMVGLRESVGRKPNTFRGSIDSPIAKGTATLLSIRQSLVHRATIGLEDIDAIRDNISGQAVDEIMESLRQLLHSEFGSQRVHRYRQALTVGHNCMETLIAGMLRVQFHSRQFELSASALGEQPREPKTPAVTWGVGDSIAEAESHRQGRRKANRS